ncbi:MopE-related protein [Corallococcus terminator]
MMRPALLCLLFTTACTVPSLDELYACDERPNLNAVFEGRPADAVLGDNFACRHVNLTLSFEGFTPGCVRVSARNGSSDEALSMEFSREALPASSGATLRVAVFPSKGWGPDLQVESRAFAGSCTGNLLGVIIENVTVTYEEVVPVTLRMQGVDADQDGYIAVSAGGTDCRDDLPAINPGAAELCNEVDDNCDGIGDTAHFQLGQDCSTSTGCTGVFRCNLADRIQYCDTPSSRNVYRDDDRDGHGKSGSTPLAVCGITPDGYTNGAPDDCDDTNSNIRPGNPDLCDGVDNNCDGVMDESFPTLNTACTDAFQCQGTIQCDGSRTAVKCMASSVAALWYPDGDGDGFGRENSVVQSCVKPEGAYVANSSDCNDGNPFTHPGAPELCDDLDNNCDGQKEPQSVCPGGVAPSWAGNTVGTSSQRWLSASSWARGGVWVGGSDNTLARLNPGLGTFAVFSSVVCGAAESLWTSVWADPNSGRAWLGSIDGRKARQDAAATTCVLQYHDGLWVHGMVGVRHNSSLSLYGATDSMSSNEGAAFAWNEVGAPTYNPVDNNIHYVYDVHGATVDTLFLAGGPATGARIYRRDPGSGWWLTEAVEDVAPDLDTLRGIWVANSQVAFAVGDSGTVLQWSLGSWFKLQFPNAHDLTSVIAFGAASAYATCASGHIYRYTGASWQQIHSTGGTRLNDITGTGPDDLWVVGNSGRILHWPSWPQ